MILKVKPHYFSRICPNDPLTRQPKTLTMACNTASTQGYFLFPKGAPQAHAELKYGYIWPGAVFPSLFVPLFLLFLTTFLSVQESTNSGGGKKPGQFPGSLSPLTSPYSPKVGRGNPTESVPQPAVQTGPALYATFSSLTYKEDPGFSLKFLGLRKLVHINWNKDYSSEIRRTEHTGEIEMHESCIFKTAFLKIPSQ